MSLSSFQKLSGQILLASDSSKDETYTFFVYEDFIDSSTAACQPEVGCSHLCMNALDNISIKSELWRFIHQNAIPYMATLLCVEAKERPDHCKERSTVSSREIKTIQFLHIYWQLQI